MRSCRGGCGSASGASRRQPRDPEAIDAITSRCLEPDAAKRFQTTAELQAAFDRLDENGKPLPIIRRLTRRTMAAAAILVLLLLGGTFYTGNMAFFAAEGARSGGRDHLPILEQYQRSDLQSHARADGETRAGRRRFHQRTRSHAGP